MLSNTGAIYENRNLMLFQQVRITYTGEFKELWSFESTGEDDFFGGTKGLHLTLNANCSAGMGSLDVDSIAVFAKGMTVVSRWSEIGTHLTIGDAYLPSFLHLPHTL